MEKLTRAQKSVLRLIFDEKLSEEEALERAKISIKVYERWFKQPSFKEEFDVLMQRCLRRSEIIITNYKELAAAKLIILTECDKEATARQVCLDILNMERQAEEKVDAQEKRVMRPETQQAILAIMADEKGKNNGS